MTLPEDISKRRATWDRSAVTYMVLGVSMMACGILTSVAIVAFTEDLDKIHIKCLSAVAGLCTALVATFNPLSIGIAFRDAWRILDSAVLRFNSEPATYPVSTLVKAVEEGELIIATATKGLAWSPPAVSSPPEK